MDTRWLPALALLATSLVSTALAQQSDSAAGTVVTSEPGKATAVRTVQISAKVVAVDKTTRTVTLQGPQGSTVDVVAGDAVKNFDQIKVGQLVVTRYTQALALELRKTKAPQGDVTESEGSTVAKPGERPAAASERQIAAIAEVVDVNPKESTITLKGPRGNTVELDVHNPDQFKVVKKGDQVNVTYTEALALSVEPAPQAEKTK